LEVSVHAESVLVVKLNRPEKGNAMNLTLWKEIFLLFEGLKDNADVRAVVLIGAGKQFSTGLDLSLWNELQLNASVAGSGSPKLVDVARRALTLRRSIKAMQNAFTAIEQCPQPVIAAIHSSCIGGAVDMICACDIRYCSKDAVFSIKEVQLGLAADVGTLQRLPKIIGNDSLLRELAYTGRNFDAGDALTLGMVSQVFEDFDKTFQAALKVAKEIASLSPVAVYGTKANLLFSRDHSIVDGLEYAATWNAAALQSEDILEIMNSKRTTKTPFFSKL